MAATSFKTFTLLLSLFVWTVSTSPAKELESTVLLDGSSGVFADSGDGLREHREGGLAVSASDEVRSVFPEDRMSKRAPSVELEESNSPETTEVIEETTTEGIVSLEEPLQEILGRITKQMLPKMLELAYDPEMSQECVSSFVKLGKALGTYEVWALKMIDAMGKPPAGALEGALSGMGSYDECLGIVAPNNDGEEDFRGQYCSLYTKLPSNPLLDKLAPKFIESNPLFRQFIKNASNLAGLQDDPFVLGMRLGLCIPSTCTAKEVHHLVEKFTKKYGIRSQVIACKIKGPVEISNTQMGLISFAIALAFLVGLASSVDIYRRRSASKGMKKPPVTSIPMHALLAFSAVTNTEKIFNAYAEPGSYTEKLQSVHGIRVISALWVVLAHVYCLVDPTTYGRAVSILEMLSDRSFGVISNGFLSVDTFFVLSGFLVTYSVLTTKMKPGPLSFIVTLYRRYVRLCLPAVCIAGILIVFPLLVSGPVVDQLIHFVNEPCEGHWWDILAVISNYRPIGDQCGPHLWYIAADFQIYAALLIFIFLLRCKRPALGITGIVVAIVATCVGVAVEVYVYNFPAYNHVDATSVMKTLTSSMEVYLKPFCHTAPFATGILAAYFFIRYPSVKIHKTVVMAAWAVAVATGLTVVYAVQDWGAGVEYTKIQGSFYAGLHRLAWGLCVAWPIYACSTGRGGYINTVLSHWIFVPFSRLSFSLYLVHMPVVVAKAASVRLPVEWTHWFVAKDYIGLVVISYMFAYLFAIFFEAPIVNIDKLIFDTIPKMKAGRVDEHNELKVTVDSTEQTNMPNKTHSLQAVFVPPVNSSKITIMAASSFKTFALLLSLFVWTVSTSPAKELESTVLLDGSSDAFVDSVDGPPGHREEGLAVRASDEVRSVFPEDRMSKRAPNVELEESNSPETTEVIEETTTEGIVSLEEPLQEIMGRITKQMLPKMLELAYDPEMSQECVSSFVKLGKALGTYEIWALKMIDAMGKPPAGALEGALSGMGSYDECLGIVAPNNDGEEDFRGQYCSLYTKLPSNPLIDKLAPKFIESNPLFRQFIKNASNLAGLQDDPFVLGMRLGICIPSTCTAKEVHHLVEKFTKKYGIKSQVTACKIKGPVEISNTQMGLISFVIALALLVGLASSVDIYRRRSASKSMKKPPVTSVPMHALLAFSAVTNTEKIFNAYTEPGSYTEKLQSVHGIRVISALWVVLAHVYSLADPTTYGRAVSILEMLSDRSFGVISNGFLSVDTFFVLSGFLVTYSILTTKMKPGPLSFIVTLYRRYVRLCLPAVCIAGILIVFPLLVSGPVVDQLIHFLNEPCEGHWWDILAVISNYRPIGDQCGPHLWYISADFQIYAGLLIFIFLLRCNRPALGITGIVVATVATCVGVGIEVYVYNIPAYNHVDATSVMKTLMASMQVYFKPFCHTAPFAMGILAAYFFIRYPSVKIHKIVVLAAWAVAVATGLTVVYAVQDWGAGVEYTKIQGSFYAGLHRLTWGLCVAWAIYACSTGRGGYINTVLSHWVFVPFSRLSFSLYLVHMPVVVAKAASVRLPVEWTHWFVAKDYIGLVVISYMFAYLFAIFFEAPIVNIDKLIFDTIPKMKSRRVDEHNELKITVDSTEQTNMPNKTNSLQAVFVLPVNSSKM
ncbi:uncharacterized protein LOC135369453 [Ornithodoros turicata]|uniref:uncharacterized protein LOC135369453 n=1 Tax=Ornithodoros turicata TaxID=34597 RepID=UPI003138A76C